MNLDNLTNIIELPLKLLDWVLNNLVLILVLVGCGYLIYFVYKNKVKIVEKINKLRGIINKDKSQILTGKEYYWSGWLKGDNTK